MMVAFLLGLVSSLHCIGMCGPLAMAIPFGENRTGRIAGTILYNAGRVTTYSMYGLVFGLIGRSFAWFGWQQKISIILGSIIIIALLVSKFTTGNSALSSFNRNLFMKLRGGLSKLLFKGNPASFYGIGILNGLLPCGMVYLALAGTISTGNPIQGALFMMVFGLGTVPAMGVMSLLGGVVKPSLRASARKLFPAMMVLMATLLILRGLNLGIPFVSPSLNITESAAVECHD